MYIFKYRVHFISQDKQIQPMYKNFSLLAHCSHSKHTFPHFQNFVLKFVFRKDIQNLIIRYLFIYETYKLKV